MSKIVRHKLHRQLLGQQYKQSLHDEHYHRDIQYLSKLDKLKHYTLHLSKYLGQYLSGLTVHNDKDRLITDAYIITLAVANLIDLDLFEYCDYQENLDTLETFADFSTFISKSYTDNRNIFVHTFAINIGFLAKACEAADHLESYTYYEDTKNSITNIFRLLVAEAHFLQIDLVKQMSNRHEQIEDKSIFNKRF